MASLKKAYLVVPNLIEQPTWGGDYIATLKAISDPQIADLRIGQSFELYQHTNLSSKTSTTHLPTIETANPADPASTQLSSQDDQVVNINQLISSSPRRVLGPKVVKQHGHQLQVLIKLTQAKGNSFQVHRRPKDHSDHWLPKAESWYYLEPGLATLGVAPDIDWHAYQDTCQQIYDLSLQLSRDAQSNKLTLEKAQDHLSNFIAAHNPTRFVNTIQVGKDQAIDLSRGGVHHSWEDNDQTHPLGNIVYEVQQNVYDPDCTIRAFDKGNIKSDGSIRPLHVDDYFKYLNRSPQANNPATHLTPKQLLKKTSTHTITQVFTTSHYTLHQLTFSKPLSNSYTTTSTSFHHLFARRGNFQLITDQLTLTITQGYSVFISAFCGRYTLKPYKALTSQVLQTLL